MLFFVSDAMAGGPSLSLNTFHAGFSTPTKQDFNKGYIDEDSRADVNALKIRIDGGDEGQSWKLYMRADSNMFSPGGYGKRFIDLKWKFDHENSNSYRRVRINKQLIASGSGKTDVIKYIDLRMMLDWSDPPANYKIGLTFTLEVE